MNAFNKVVELDPLDADAWYQIGFIHNDNKAYDLAIEAYTKVINLQPTAGDAYYERGVAYYELYFDDNACQDWKKGAELGDEYSKVQVESLCNK